MMSLVAGRQPLLERQALVQIGPGLGGGRIADSGQVGLVQPRLLGELPAVAPFLDLPNAPAAVSSSASMPASANLSAGGFMAHP